MELWNITQQSYPHDKLEFCIDDDGTDPFLKNDEEKKALQDLIHPIKLNYKYHKHRKTIGAKRNDLTKQASYKIIACMDSDDIYMPTYPSYAVSTLRLNKMGICGSQSMLFTYPFHNFQMSAISCMSKRQIHEGCSCIDIKHFRSTNGFLKSSQGEGTGLLDYCENRAMDLDITLCMICVDHGENTIAKEQFRKNIIDGKVCGIHKEVLRQIMLQQYPDKMNHQNQPDESGGDDDSVSVVSPSSS